MSVTPTSYKHVVLSEEGVPLIAGTTTKVVELVAEQKGFGFSPDEMHQNHPYLSFGQIYSALAYYRDHREEIDEDLERRQQHAERLQRELPTSPFVERLRSQRRSEEETS